MVFHVFPAKKTSSVHQFFLETTIFHISYHLLHQIIHFSFTKTRYKRSRNRRSYVHDNYAKEFPDSGPAFPLRYLKVCQSYPQFCPSCAVLVRCFFVYLLKLKNYDLVRFFVVFMRKRGQSVDQLPVVLLISSENWIQMVSIQQFSFKSALRSAHTNVNTLV